MSIIQTIWPVGAVMENFEMNIQNGAAARPGYGNMIMIDAFTTLFAAIMVCSALFFDEKGWAAIALASGVGTAFRFSASYRALPAKDALINFVLSCIFMIALGLIAAALGWTLAMVGIMAALLGLAGGVLSYAVKRNVSDSGKVTLAVAD